MSDDDFKLVYGSGNVFADFGHPNGEVEQLKAILAAQIIRVLNERGLTVRAAEQITDTPAADFSRIRRAKIDCFTIDRLTMVLARLDQRVEVDVRGTERTAQEAFSS